MSSTKCLVLTTVIIIGIGTVVSNAVVMSESRIESPDGRFAVECKTGEQLVPDVGRIEILEISTGKVPYATEIDPPLYALKWTGDSKTLIAIERVAGGSVAGIIHLCRDGWGQFQADSRQPGTATVVGFRPTTHNVELSYKVSQKPSHQKRGKFYLEKFTVDPETGRHSDESIHEIDVETYDRLHLN